MEYRKASADGLDLVNKYRLPIMGVATLWILLLHTWDCLFWDIRFVGRAELFIKATGYVGVDLFFLLSGIGLTRAIAKRLPIFYARRFSRILPPFLLVGLIHLLSGKWNATDFLGSVSGVYFFTRSIHSYSWFIPATMIFYLLFPLYYKVFLKRPLGVYLLSIALWLAASLMLRDTMREDLWGFTNRIPIFLTGIYLGWRSQQKRPLTLTPIRWLCLGAVLILGVYLAFMTNFRAMRLLLPSPNCCIPSFLLAVSLPFFIAKFIDLLVNAHPLRWLGRGLCAMLNLMGAASLEIYCVQSKDTILRATKGWARSFSDAAVAANLAALIGTVFVGYLLYIGCTLLRKLFAFLRKSAHAS